MARLPAPLQPAFPQLKKAHRLATRRVGAVTRLTAPLAGKRALPTAATETAEETALREPDSARFHLGGPAEPLRRTMPVGTPPEHWFFGERLDFDVPRRFTLELTDGVVVGNYAAHITRGGVLDFETSPYFGIDGWQEHPLFLRPRLPRAQQVAGTLLSLATRGSWGNYYHWVMDTLPRWGVLRESVPDARPDVLFVNTLLPYHREYLALLGLDGTPHVEATKHSAVRAERLLVPCIPNPHTIGPAWTTEWLRETFKPQSVADKPKRIYVTRGGRAHTRRVTNEAEVLASLPRDFVVVDPGRLSVREQIDQFAAAEVIVAPHGAALTNLNFCSPGVRILELFAPQYLNPGYWGIASNVPEARYRYLVGRGDDPGRGSLMNDVMADITVDLRQLRASFDDLIS
jgi:capsular polysaccharide biosynthesis protein